jgi:glycosyltransferase involved in cell wall biosynthesis
MCSRSIQTPCEVSRLLPLLSGGGRMAIVTPGTRRLGEKRRVAEKRRLEDEKRREAQEAFTDRVSVVIPFSSVDYVGRLRSCLRSLDAQEAVGIDLVLSVLHRNETKNLWPLLEMIGRRRFTIVFQSFKGKHWLPSLSRNAGFRYASESLVGCLDADAVLHPWTLRETVKAIRDSKGKGIVRVATKMMPQRPGDPVFDDFRPEVFSRNASAYGKEAEGPGCLIVAPRSRVVAVRGWDERYIGYGPADWDYFKRLCMGPFHAVNLAVKTGIWSMHQAHSNKGKIDSERQKKNRELYYDVRAGRGVVAPNEKWGGVHPDKSSAVVVPVEGESGLRRLEKICKTLRKMGCSHAAVRVVAVSRSDLSADEKRKACRICRQNDAVVHFSGESDEEGRIESAVSLLRGRDVVVASGKGAFSELHRRFGREGGAITGCPKKVGGLVSKSPSNKINEAIAKRKSAAKTSTEKEGSSWSNKTLDVDVVISLSGTTFLPHLRNCLAAVRRQTFPWNDTGVIISCVLHEGYDKNALCQVAMEYEAALVFTKPRHETFSRGFALNVGVRHGSRKLIALMDADVVLHRSTISQAVSQCAAGAVMAVIPVARSEFGPDHKIWTNGGLKDDTFWKKYSEKLPFAKEGYGNAVVVRDVFERIGGHDERFYGWGGIDTDIYYRMLKCGPVVELVDMGMHKALHQKHDVPLSRRNPEHTTRNRKILSESHSVERNQERWGRVKSR